MVLRTPSVIKMPNNMESNRFVVLGGQYLVNRPGGQSRVATVLNIRTSKNGEREMYVSFAGADKRLDTWVKEGDIGSEVSMGGHGTAGVNGDHGGTNIGESSSFGDTRPGVKRKQSELDANGDGSSDKYPDLTLSEASTPEREHANATRVRNFEDVRFGEYLIKTWYYSPYPLPSDLRTAHGDLPHLHAESSTSGATKSNAATGLGLSRANSSRKGKAAVTNESSHTNGQGHGHGHGHGPDKPTGNDRINGRGLTGTATRTAAEMFALGVGKGGEGARGRLWVCDLCFKYMKTRDGWERHTSTCQMMNPPGRKVYQRGSYTIWEIDGAVSPLYCQNLSLFGKLFIDHKSVFYHVEGFLFYVLCDAATSRRDQVMAFFSKERQSYDDNNLACIITFPPFQNNGFGKLLIEFSYVLTKHPSTRSITGSPGTPERPLSDLGLKGYTAYWIAVILRFCRSFVDAAPPIVPFPPPTSPSKGERPRGSVDTVATSTTGRSLRERRSSVHVRPGEKSQMKSSNHTLPSGLNAKTVKDRLHKGQYSLTLTLSEIAEACHIRIDDAAFSLAELGFLKHRRQPPASVKVVRQRRSSLRNSISGSRPNALSGLGHTGLDGESGPGHGHGHGSENGSVHGHDDGKDLGEWKDVEVVIARDMIEQAWKKWRVKEKGVLDESCVLL